MSKQERKAGRLIRNVERADRDWRAGGKQEGRTENKLAHLLGRAARAGLGAAASRVRNR